MLENIIWFTVIIMLIFCGVCIIYVIGAEIYKLTLRYETSKEYVKVYKKEYKNAHSTTILMPVDEIMIPQTQHHKAEYNIYIIYDEEIYCINNKDLFDIVDSNDIICVYAHKGYNRQNVLKDIYFDVE